MTEKLPKNYTCIVHYKNGKVVRYETKAKRRFLTQIRTIKWGNTIKNVYLRVSYGKHKDVFNRNYNFYNDGNYNLKDEFWGAFDAFDELNEKDF